MMPMKTIGMISTILLAALLLNMSVMSVISIQQPGDFFRYSETITVNNGQGSYGGYTDQTLITGAEQVSSVTGSNVLTTYNSSYQYGNNQGNSTSGSSAGTFTWSSDNFTYTNGTDNQAGYTAPIFVWFAMNTSLPVGATFFLLNTQFTVASENHSFQLPGSESLQGGTGYVQTIEATGTGQYQRNDDYGTFTASYTWNAFFDPTTGYIIGYNYVEQDTGQYQGQAGSFTYTDNLHVTSTSYSLTPASPPSTSPGTGLAGIDSYVLFIIAAVIVLLVVAMIVYAATRKNRRGESLPQHSTVPPAPSVTSPSPWESKIDLGSKPPEQVVIKEVEMVTCRYCKTLYPASADRCPYCGGPRQ